MLPIHLYPTGTKPTNASSSDPFLSISFDDHYYSTHLSCIGGRIKNTGGPCTPKLCPIYTLCTKNKPLMHELLNPFIPATGYTILDKDTTPEFFL